MTSAADAQTPTLSPEMYWDGDGNSPGMTHYEQGGRYLRFTDFPVQVYLPYAIDSRWQTALDHAVEQLAEIMSMERTSHLSEAEIVIRVISPEQLALDSPCDAEHTEGCGVIIPVGEPDEANFRVVGRVWIKADSTLPADHLLLHELIHALGLLVHSPDPGDVMYNGSEATPTILSARDRATLTYLYQQPAWGE